MATVWLCSPFYSNPWYWTSELAVSFFVFQSCTCSLTVILSYTLLKLLAIFTFYLCCFNWTRIHAVSLRIIWSVIFAKNLFCVIHQNSPKYHISTAWAERSGANAWASAHALSMVTWYHQKIVVGHCSVMFHPWNFKPQILNDVLMLYILFANLLGCPTHAFCPPIKHICQSPNSKSFHCPWLLACVPSTNFTDLW